MRRISVNSFGFGGTNTHIVLDDAYHYLQERGLTGNHCTVASPSLTSNGIALNGFNGHAQSKPRLLVWSAADEKAIKRTIEQQQAFYKDQVSGDPEKLDRLAYTLATRRSRMLWRASAIVTEGSANLTVTKPVRSSGEAGLAFVFTGQGAQYADMGLELVQHFPVFAETLRLISDIYSGLGCDWELLEELRNTDNIDRPEYSQPLCTAVQLALVELLKSFDIVPKAVVGHSSGEMAAAYAVGALSLESACRVSYFRGLLAGRLRASSSSAGAMISASLAEEQVPAYLEKIGVAGGVSVACVNSPLNCTLSGLETAIDAVKEQTEKDSIFSQKLKTGVAYHSPDMLAIAGDYLQLVGTLEAASSAVSIPMISTVTGKTVHPAVLTTAQYWVDNMVSPVRFADAIQALTQPSSTWKANFDVGSITDLLEVGPTAALRRPVAETLAKAGPRAKPVQYSSVLYRKRSAVVTTLELVGRLFAYGHPVSIAAVNQSGSGGGFLVDCPKYSFDHDNKYWAESRISRDYRLRGVVLGETLGTRVADWDPLEPKWRNFLSVESEPWIADHKVRLLTTLSPCLAASFCVYRVCSIDTCVLTGLAQISDTVVYPAAGMLIMAMEAALQMVPPNRTIAGYSVKEARFLSPIVVGKTWEDRTETVVQLRPVSNSYQKDSTWSDIRIFCHRNKEWSDCFSARVQVQYEEDASQVDASREKRLHDQDVLRLYEHAVEACTKPVDSHVFYRNAADHGLLYGPSFQLLDDLHWDGKMTAVARIGVSKPQFRTTSLVHPTVLDAVFHILRASSQALASASSTNVPVKLVDAWFSASGWQNPQVGSLRCWGTANVEQDSGEDGTIYALGDNGEVLMSLGHLVTVSVSRPDEGDVSARKLLHRVEWKPQLSLLTPGQLTQACAGGNRVVKDDAIMLAHHGEMTSVMNLALSRTLRYMTAAEREKLPPSLERHMAWMEHHVGTLKPAQKDDPAAPISDEEIEQRLRSIESMHSSWELHTNVVRELKNILVGAKDPLEVIFDSNLADVFYADMFAQICDVRLRNFLELASHENPGLRILEVGAGTGGFTGHILSALQSLEEESGGLRLAEYTYTDVSPMFFERARERWKALEGRISFKTLDVERTLEGQGFEVGSYDLLVAGSVLHATADLVATMKNVRAALKPGGRVVILEVVAPEDVVVNFSFGLVPGWWLAREKWREMSPLLNEEQWDACLRETGYSGNDLVLRDTEEDRCHICSIIVATAVEEVTAPLELKHKILVVVGERSEMQVELAKVICSHVQESVGGESSSVLSLGRFQETRPSPEDVVLCLAGLDTPLLCDMSQDRLAWLQNLIRHTRKLLWVTASNLEDPRLPLYAQAQGFFRSVRLETADSQMVTLAIESQDEPSVASCAQHVIKVLQVSFLDSSSNELEYVVRHGLLETCRVAEDVKGNAALKAMLHPQAHQKPWSEGPALSLSIKTVGTLDSLCFTEDIADERKLAADEVEIEAKAWGVNFRDVLQALGRLEEKTFGYDCAGTVTRVGSGCSGSFRVGDRVCMVSPGCMRQYPRAHAMSVLKIPKDDMSFAAAAAVLVPGMTALHALVDVARIGKGDTVLIHGAAGSTGQMAVTVAQKKGAIAYATVGSESKTRFLVDVLGVPEDHIFHSRNTSFAQAIRRVTKGRGVDVVLNSLSGDGLRASWECMARCGRFVEIGKVDILANSGLPMSSFARNVSFSAVDLREILLEDPCLTADLLQKTMQFVDETGATPKPVHSFPASQIEQAFRTLQSGQNIGRVVIEPRVDDVVLVSISISPLLWILELTCPSLVAISPRSTAVEV